VAGRAKVAAFTGECEEIFVAAVFAFHAGKTLVQVAAIEIAIYNAFNIISAPVPSLPGLMKK
jgi:hypothetical protein